jgi:hypothetical protein
LNATTLDSASHSIAYHSAQTNANAIANATANIHRHSFANGFSQRFSVFIPDDTPTAMPTTGVLAPFLRQRAKFRESRARLRWRRKRFATLLHTSHFGHWTLRNDSNIHESTRYGS